jgi:hypothetical protein
VAGGAARPTRLFFPQGICKKRIPAWDRPGFSLAKKENCD